MKTRPVIAFPTALQKAIILNMARPTLELLQQVTPHIPPGVVAAEYQRVAEDDPAQLPAWYFAVPGLHVRGVFHHFRLHSSPRTGLRLEWAYCGNFLVRDPGRITSYAREAHEWQKANLDYAHMADPVADQDWFSDDRSPS